MAEHTPGPWQVLNSPVLAATDNLMVRRFNNPYNPYNLLTMHLGTDPKQWAEQEANARLIAAAPDMMAALKAIYRVAKTASLPGPVHLSIEEVYTVRDAIAKAEVS